MTLAAAWLDWTDEINPRLICFADSRISNTATRKSITEHSTKLFRFEVAVHHMENFDLATGTLTSPYSRFPIGLAYAGDLVLADTVTSILAQTLSNLATEDSSQPALQWAEIIGHVETVVRAVAANYSAIKPMATTFLVFAYIDARYHLTKVTASKAGDVTVDHVDIYKSHQAIGSGAASFDSAVAKARPHHRAQQSLARRQFENADVSARDDLEVDLWLARRDSSQALRVEFQRQMGTTGGVGGTMQLMEVTPSFVQIRKTDTGDFLGAPHIEQVGRFQVLFVSEPV